MDLPDQPDPKPPWKSLSDQSQSGLGSLAQNARVKHLKSARTIFVIVGLLTIAVNVFSWISADKLIDAELKKQTQELERQGMVVSPEAAQEWRDSAVRATKLFAGGLIAVGVLYLIFAVVVDKFPVPITICGLVMYLAAAAIFGLLDPKSLLQGFIIKIVIIVALVKAVQAAIAYERERKLSAEGSI